MVGLDETMIRYQDGRVSDPPDLLAQGFPGERIRVMPRPAVHEALRQPLTSRLLVTDCGLFPAAAAHRRTRPDGSPQAIVIICTEGAGWCTLPGGHLRVSPGEALIIPPGTPHVYGAATDDKLAWLRAAAGDRFDDLEIQSFVGFTNFTDDRSALAEMMAGAFGVAPEEAIETPVVLAGTLEEMIDDLQARRERWLMSYVVVGVDVMEQFAPAVARLAGT